MDRLRRMDVFSDSPQTPCTVNEHPATSQEPHSRFFAKGTRDARNYQTSLSAMKSLHMHVCVSVYRVQYCVTLSTYVCIYREIHIYRNIYIYTYGRHMYFVVLLLQDCKMLQMYFIYIYIYTCNRQHIQEHSCTERTHTQYIYMYTDR